MEISAITFFPRHTRITVRFHHSLYSSQVDRLQTHLLDMLPSLREHICYNRSGLPFVEELENTELGHVFEHIMLAILEQRGLCTSGQTTWNWHRDPIGTYHVTLATGKKHLVKESILVAQTILTNLLVGPVLQIQLPESRPAARREPLPVYRLTKPRGKPARQLLFASRPARHEGPDSFGASTAADEVSRS
jgi:cyanophycin synthase-like protein